MFCARARQPEQAEESREKIRTNESLHSSSASREETGVGLFASTKDRKKGEEESRERSPFSAETITDLEKSSPFILSFPYLSLLSPFLPLPLSLYVSFAISSFQLTSSCSAECCGKEPRYERRIARDYYLLNTNNAPAKLISSYKMSAYNRFLNNHTTFLI